MEHKWFKRRHVIIKRLYANSIKPRYRKNYQFQYDKLDLTEPVLVLCNHQTAIDQFIISIAGECNGYFVISDDLVNRGLVSKALIYATNPIPYKKGSVDFNFFRTCKKVISENQSIIIFPEGNRTYSGKTGYMNKTIVKMIRFLKIPVILSRIEGGFYAIPRYSRKSGTGPISYKIIKRLEYDEYNQLTDEELFKQIEEALFECETISEVPYPSKTKAEYLERVFYVCPDCGLSTFYSKGHNFTCLKCHQEFTIDDYGRIDHELSSILKWYDYQIEYLKTVFSKDENEILFQETVDLWEVSNRYSKKRILKKATITLFNNRMVINKNQEEYCFWFKDIASSGVFGANKFNIFLKEQTYQICFDERFNALKYVHLIYLFKQKEGKITDGFMGI